MYLQYHLISYTVVFFRVVFLSELRSWEDLKLAWNSAKASQDSKIRPCRLKYSRYVYVMYFHSEQHHESLFVTKQISEFGPISLVFLSHCRFLQRLGRGAFGEAQHRASQQFIGSVDKSKQDCKDTWDLHIIYIYILCIRILYMYIYMSYHVTIICISHIKCVYNWLHVHIGRECTLDSDCSCPFCCTCGYVVVAGDWISNFLSVFFPGLTQTGSWCRRLKPPNSTRVDNR